MISKYEGSINREKLPALLEKPFLMQLLDPQSQNLQTLMAKIQNLPSQEDKIRSTLYYIGLGVLNAEQYRTIIDSEPLTSEYLNKILESETNIYTKIIIIQVALAQKAIANITVEGLATLCGVVKDDDYKSLIIQVALEQKAITNITVEECIKYHDGLCLKEKIRKKEAAQLPSDTLNNGGSCTPLSDHVHQLS